MWWVTDIGNPYLLVGIATIAAVILYRTSAKYWSLALLLTVPGGLLLNLLLKITFRRPRPQFNPSVTGYSFPSGHAMVATLMYGFMVVYAVRKWRSSFWRAVIVLSSGFLLLLVGLSRVYIEAHYLSDVLAAITAGFAWLVLCLLAVLLLKRQKRKLNRSQTR
jgi:undecaprenyl-diphosphatase